MMENTQIMTTSSHMGQKPVFSIVLYGFVI